MWIPKPSPSSCACSPAWGRGTHTYGLSSLCSCFISSEQDFVINIALHAVWAEELRIHSAAVQQNLFFSLLQFSLSIAAAALCLVQLWAWCCVCSMPCGAEHEAEPSSRLGERLRPQGKLPSPASLLICSPVQPWLQSHEFCKALSTLGCVLNNTHVLHTHSFSYCKT